MPVKFEKISINLPEAIRPVESFIPQRTALKTGGVRIYREIDTQMKALFAPLQEQLAKYLDTVTQLTLTITAADQTSTYTGKSTVIPADSELGRSSRKTQTFTFEKKKDTTTLPKTLELRYSNDALLSRKYVGQNDKSLVQWIHTKGNEAVIIDSQNRYSLVDEQPKITKS